MSYVYCPECGFQNAEGANYCSRCGALLPREQPADATLAFVPEPRDEDAADALADVGADGPALVVRAGGGRVGESFLPQGERTTIGRSPDCEIFLDDVTVSRRHAVLVQRDGGVFIEDQGSLNGTYVNKRRIESARLEEGDEVQIGKYRLTFLSK